MISLFSSVKKHKRNIFCWFRWTEKNLQHSYVISSVSHFFPQGAEFRHSLLVIKSYLLWFFVCILFPWYIRESKERTRTMNHPCRLENPRNCSWNREGYPWYPRNVPEEGCWLSHWTLKVTFAYFFTSQIEWELSHTRKGAPLKWKWVIWESLVWVTFSPFSRNSDPHRIRTTSLKKYFACTKCS